MTRPRLLLEGLGLPEAPRHAPNGRIVLSDVWTEAVIELDVQSGAHRVLGQVPGRPNGLGWLPDGRMLAVSMQQRRLFVLAPGGFVPSIDLSHLAGDLLNELVVDAQGRAYVSDHVLAPGATPAERHANAKPASLFLIDFAAPASEPEPRRVADDLLGPNGMVLTPDGRTLIVAETGGGRLTAFDIAPDGSLHARRVWAPLPLAPDGISMDPAGRVWVASSYPRGDFIRVAEGGTIDGRIDTEGHGGFACLVDGETLILLEASVPTQPAQRAGRVRVVDLCAAHIARFIEL